jgi:hypothetical protein
MTSDSWFRVKDIQDDLLAKGKTSGVLKGVSNDLLILTASGFIEMRNIGLWSSYKEFRAFIKIM